jgi:hypothetical protein
MPIAQSQITLLFQGPILGGPGGTADLITRTRRAFPGSPCLLSTWTGSDPAGIDADGVVFSPDPGGLPGIKTRDRAGELNNVNRQIRSTQRGLEPVRTPYALKIRTDCALDHAGVAAAFERVRASSPAAPRILACSLFTVDPQMFEQMPYHVSDWLQFGPTEALHLYWSVPFMSAHDATFYDRHPHAPHSTFMDRRFRTRLAVEQYLAAHYAARFDYPVPHYHNDVRPDVLDGHRRFLARHWVIADPWNLGLHFPKYAWAYHSSFQRLNCLLAMDWFRLYHKDGGTAPAPDAARAVNVRLIQKRMARLLGRCLDQAGPLLVRPGLKQVVNRLLTVLARPTGTATPAVHSDRRTPSPDLVEHTWR